MSFSKIPLFLIMGIVALPQLSETIYTPSLPIIADALGVSATMVEHTLTVYLLGFALGVFLWGTLSDRFGRKICLLGGIFVYAAASLGCFFSSTVSMLMIMRFMQAVGGSAGSVLGQAIARDSISLEMRGLLFSKISMALACAPALGPIIGTAVTAYAGWRAVFIVLILYVELLAINVACQLPETARRNKDLNYLTALSTCFGKMIRDKNLIASGIMIGAVNGLMFGYFAEAPFFYKQMLKASDTFFGVISSTLMPGLLLGSFLSKLMNQSGARPARIILRGITAISTSALVFLVITSGIVSLGNFAILLMAPLLVAAAMVGVTMIIPNVLGTVLEPYSNYAGTAASLFGLYYYILIAGFSGLMAVMHTGTVISLPAFFILVSITLAAAYRYGKFAAQQ